MWSGKTEAGHRLALPCMSQVRSASLLFDNRQLHSRHSFVELYTLAFGVHVIKIHVMFRYLSQNTSQQGALLYRKIIFFWELNKTGAFLDFSKDIVTSQ